MIESATIYGIPRSHWHCQLSNFDWETVTPPSLREHVESFLSKVLSGESPHLLLTGAPGIGKSHLGIGVYRVGVGEFGTLEVMWVNIPDFCDRVKASYGSGEGDPFEDYREATRLVILDDFFGRDLSAHEIGQVVYRLIDLAYMSNAAVLLTMNDEVKTLATFLKPHEVSRILQDSTIIPMTATKDWRRG